MIPKIFRLNLRTNKDFFINSKRYYADNFIVFYCPTSLEKQSQLTVVVPKKQVKKRVNRSKVKRQVYAAALPLLVKSKGLEVVLVAKRNISRVSFSEIADGISKIWKNIS